MPADELGKMLSDATVEVLESMFFTSLAGDAESSEAPAGIWISAGLAFYGNPSGRLGVRVPRETGRKIAASFLGQEEDALSESQVGEVVCELANMICGSLLSRLEGDTRFELFHPELDPVESGFPASGRTFRRLFELEEGALGVWLELEPAR